MPASRLKQLQWNKKGVERLEYFMAEQIVHYALEQALGDWSDQPDSLIDSLRCVQGERIDGAESPDFLSMPIAVAGNVMGNMMAQELMKALLPPNAIAALVEDAIKRAINDEEYDRLHKDKEEYDLS